MQFTAEQKREIERQRQLGQRILVDFTPEQEAEWKRLVAAEMAAKPENQAWARKFFAALEEPGFSGDLRRAISTSKRTTEEIVDATGIDPMCLDQFRIGEGELPSAAIDRLVQYLGLRLVAETH